MGLPRVALTSALVLASLSSAADDVRIAVHADRPGHRISRHLTGACIEDVNHEIYGGLYSQMLFGESFQEPAPAAPVEGFAAHGGAWRLEAAGEVWGEGGPGPKLVSAATPPFGDGEVGIEVKFDDARPGNAGLIVRVSTAGAGADNFDGYEVSLDPAAKILRLGRHRHDWQLLGDTPCEVPAGRWIQLVARLTGSTIEVLVDGRSVVRYEDRDRPLPAGTVGVRQWQREARYRNLWVKIGGAVTPLPFLTHPGPVMEVSGMWRPARRGAASGSAAIVTEKPFVGVQSQRMVFESGEGAFGIENQGLNRWGLSFVEGKPYEGYVWARAEMPVELHVSIESADGSAVLAEEALSVAAGDWQRLDFALTPRAAAGKGRFAAMLTRPGSVTLGHAFLEPGAWGRFKGLPVRRDVAEALIDQGITVLRYGGSMVNHEEYRWKKMIGPRDRRPPYRGTWYPHSTNGWGILDFIEFCNAAGFLCIPAFNMGETPQDMADFVEYVNGSVESPWGRKRAEHGHPESYRLRYLELGNEERVDDAYFAKFKPMAEAIWAKDREIVIVVGDFVYTKPIIDPFNFTGSVVGLTSLAAQQKILALARERDREVWFDIHVGTDGPRPDATFEAMLSFVDALGKIAGGARHRVVVFEFNAGNHAHRRALANALAINAIERDGRIPVATSANCLQPDGQNDNGWDQGLLFLNPSQVWLQPPGHVTRMISRAYQPLHVPVEVSQPAALDVSAKRSEDGAVLVLTVVNANGEPARAAIAIEGFTPSKEVAVVEELSGPLDAVNTASDPHRIVPRRDEWRHEVTGGVARRAFPPHSVTVVRFE